MPLVNAKAPSANPITIDGKTAAKYARHEINSLYGKMRYTQRELYRRAYQGHAYNTAEYFTALGTDAAAMLDLMDSIVAIVEKLKPGTIPADKRTHPANIQKQADGSVIVSQPSDEKPTATP